MRRTLGIADRVRLLGWRRDLPTIYGATDVFLLTSRNEGTPVALIEAMASGVPGVSTDVGGVRDVIDSPDVGARVPDGDAAGLAAHIVRYLADPDLRRRTGAARPGPAVLDRYSLDRLVGDIAALYSELLAVRKHRCWSLASSRCYTPRRTWSTSNQTGRISWTDQSGYIQLGRALATTGRLRALPKRRVHAGSHSHVRVTAFLALIYLVFGTNNQMAGRGHTGVRLRGDLPGIASPWHGGSAARVSALALRC